MSTTPTILVQQNAMPKLGDACEFSMQSSYLFAASVVRRKRVIESPTPLKTTMKCYFCNPSAISIVPENSFIPAFIVRMNASIAVLLRMIRESKIATSIIQRGFYFSVIRSFTLFPFAKNKSMHRDGLIRKFTAVCGPRIKSTRALVPSSMPIEDSNALCIVGIDEGIKSMSQRYISDRWTNGNHYRSNLAMVNSSRHIFIVSERWA